jgi:DNA-binding XRE family transcriptional regulator
MGKANLIVKGRKAARSTTAFRSVRNAGDDVLVIRDAAGEPLYALVPWSDYERMTAAGDETAFLIAAAEAARGDETFPAEVANRIIDGEPALKVLREWRKLTQGQLAKDAGVAAQYVSQIERGTRRLGLEAARKLAPVLGVSPGALVDM